MARMNWSAANSRDLVFRRGAERLNLDTSVSKGEGRQERLDREAGNLSCGSTDKNHRWGPKHVLPGGLGVEGQNCVQCGQTKVLKGRLSKVSLLSESQLVKLQY